MRYSTFVPLVAAAATTAFVIPDEVMAKQLTLAQDSATHKTEKAWQDHMPSFENLDSSAGKTGSSPAEAFIDGVQAVVDTLSDSGFDDPFHWGGRPGRGKHHPHHQPTTNLTIYQFIQQSEDTTRFAEIIDKYPDIVATLNGTQNNVTFFVPTNKAFEKIPKDHGEPSKELVEKILKYHIVPGNFPVQKVLASYTLPTTLKEDALGGRPQRLRVNLGLSGLRINFFSKVTWGNLFAPNGVVHGVDLFLLPPFPGKAIISHFPQKFSTLILAAEKSAVGKDLHGLTTTGATFFAPTNWAFEKLGPRANAFLFNTDKGRGYLKALLKYHLVVNETLYSDEYYGRERTGFDTETSHYHIDLPTLLAEKSLNIDISRFAGFVDIKINGHVHVSHQDIIAKEGAIHVVDSILIPPHKHQSEDVGDDEMEVEDLMERLDPYLEEEHREVKTEVYSGEL